MLGGEIFEFGRVPRAQHHLMAVLEEAAGQRFGHVA
jgi:hypothetical protein